MSDVSEGFMLWNDELRLFLMSREFFGISEEFPFSQLMVRCDSGKKRNIYFVSPVIKDLVMQNEDRFKVSGVMQSSRTWFFRTRTGQRHLMRVPGIGVRPYL